MIAIAKQTRTTYEIAGPHLEVFAAPTMDIQIFYSLSSGSQVSCAHRNVLFVVRLVYPRLHVEQPPSIPARRPRRSGVVVRITFRCWLSDLLTEIAP